MSDDSTIVYERSYLTKHKLVRIDKAQGAKAMDIPSQTVEDPRVSPDGGRLAYEDASEGDDIWVLDLRRGVPMRLTVDPGDDETPVWSPDGHWVAYAGSHAGTGTPFGVFRTASDGSGAEEMLFSSTSHVHVDDWSGNSLLLSLGDENARQLDLWVLPLDGKSQARPLLTTKFDEFNGRLSSDQRWIAYTSNESGRDEIYVRAYPSLMNKIQISRDGGDQAVWSRAGKDRTLYYRSGKQLMAVDLTGDTVLKPSAQRPILPDIYEFKGRSHTGYDVAPDGSFTFVRDNNIAADQYLTVVEKFLPELKRRMTTR